MASILLIFILFHVANAKIPLCAAPMEGCQIVTSSLADCEEWSGCEWTAKKQCQTSSTCNEATCTLKDLGFRLSVRNLPGCLQGNATRCWEQSVQVFRALKLDAECFLEEPVQDEQEGGEEEHLLQSGDTVLFVDANLGSDSNNNGRTKQSPLQTIPFALDRLRRLRNPAQNMKIIYLLPGVHRLSSPITLGPHDSNLRIEGVGEGVVVSGASLLSDLNWERVLATNIFKAKLPSSLPVDNLSRLFLNNEPAIRARSPNINGYLDPFRFVKTVNNIESWTHANKLTPVSKIIRKTIKDSNVFRYGLFDYGFGGQCENRFEPPVGYWCDPQADGDMGCPLEWPQSVTFTSQFSDFLKMDQWSPNNATTTPPLYFHTLHPLKWGGWTFEVPNPVGSSPRTLTFSRGGFQEARGDCGAGGGDFFLENAYSLLDFWNEFYLDAQSGTVFYFSKQAPSQDLVVELGNRVPRLIEVLGTSVNPVRNVHIANIQFEKTYATHMEPHEMPSGGDIALHRGGALFFEGVIDISVQDCTFVNLGSNAVFLSKFVRQALVQRNVFTQLEGSAILLVGDPLYLEVDTPWDRTRDEEYVSNVVVKQNLAYNLGIVEKQSAAVVVSLCRNLVVEENVFFNGPRAGIVLNDVFAGNIVLRKNVLFEFVLETLDHGPYNVWSRQQWLFPFPVEPVVIEHNFIVGTKDGQKLIDCDDGTQDHIVRNNVLVHGYIKFKGYGLNATGNLIAALHPEQQWGCLLLLATHRVPASWTFNENTCYLAGTLPPYFWRSSTQSLCSQKDFSTQNNVHVNFKFTAKDWRCGTSIKQWTESGQDTNTSWIRTPALPRDILEQSQAKLELFYHTFHPTTATPSTSPTSSLPTNSPSLAPTSSMPSLSPTYSQPTSVPSSSRPSKAPTSSRPSKTPTLKPSTLSPTLFPSKSPSKSQPTKSPTRFPQRTNKPTQSPDPTFSPSTLSPTRRFPLPNSSSPTSSSPSSTSPTNSPTADSPTNSPSVNSPTNSPTTNSPSSTPTSRLPCASSAIGGSSSSSLHSISVIGQDASQKISQLLEINSISREEINLLKAQVERLQRTLQEERNTRKNLRE